MPTRELGIEEILTRLAEAPKRITALTDGLDPARLRLPPAPDEWSANDVLAHLRACADVWGGSIATILAEDHPTIRAIDPRTWMRQTDYLDLEFQPSLEEYAAQRAGLMHVLEALAPDAWSRAATATGAGRPLERTARSFAQRLAVHERPHIRQIGRVAGTMRRQS